MHKSKDVRTSKETKTGQVIRIEQEQLNNHLDKAVRGTMERTLNEIIDAEAHRWCGSGRYERTEARKDISVGHYARVGDQRRPGKAQSSQAAHNDLRNRHYRVLPPARKLD